MASLSDQLIGTMREVRDAVDRNTRAVSEMEASAHSIRDALSGTADLSGHNSATISTLGAGFAELSAQFSEMDRQTGRLAELVTILQGTVSAFGAN